MLILTLTMMNKSSLSLLIYPIAFRNLSADEIFRKELAKLKDPEQRVTTDADELRTPAGVKAVLPGCILVPTGRVPVPASSVLVPTGSITVTTDRIPVPAGDTTVPTDDVTVHSSNSTNLMFDCEPTTRFPCPSDLGNHNPSPGIFSSLSYDDEFDTNLNNVASSVEVSPVPTTRINTIHPQSLIIGDPTSIVQTRSMVKQNTTVEPRSVAQAIEDPSWVDARQEEMQQFKFQNEKGIDYDEVFAPISRIEAIRLFLAFASDMGFLVYQMDVKSAFLYGRIKEEVYVTQPKGFVDPQHPKKVYKNLFLKKNNRDIILVQVYVDDIVFGSTKKECCDEFEALMKGEFQMSAMRELTFFLGLQVQQRPDGIFIHQYKSMIGSLMYLTALRPDIMFAVSACSRHQVTPTTSNLEAIKKIFKYLKGQPKLGLWYPKESPFMLDAYSDSDYVGANKDRKSTTGGCQFLGRRLISWQCKKQTIVATSSTEAEYVAAANCCGQHKHSTILQQSSMAALKYKEEHNKVGYLLKPTGSDDYHQIIDFLSGSHIRESKLGPPAILAKIDKTPYTITEALVRSRLHLADDEGVVDLPIPKIYYGMDNLGYVTKGKLTFFKNKFSPQWRFLVHTLLHCLSTKSESWDQFETRVTKQYKVLVFSSKLFANMRLNFAGNPMPLLPAMLLQAQAGEGAEVTAQDVPHPMPARDQSPTHLPTPSRPQSPDPVAPVLKHDHISAQSETAAGSIPTTEDAPLGGDLHPSRPRSSHAPPTGQPSGGVEDPITLTGLSFIVSTLVQKVHSLEAELHDHKKLFKDVVGKLVKKVKSLEVKLKTKKRKLVVSDSDPEDSTTQDMDLDALHALANAAVAADSDIPSGNTLHVPSAIPPGAFGVAPGASGVAPGASGVALGASGVSPDSSVPLTAASAIPADSLKVPAAVPADSLNVPAGASSKGKSLMVEEDIPVTARSFRQREEDRLGKEAAKRLHEEEMAELERERAEAQRKKQQEVLESAKFYNKDDWLNIRAQVEANASLSQTLLGDDVNEDNFPTRMAALIKKKQQALAEQLFKERHNRPLTPAQQKAYMQKYVKNQSSAIYNTGWTMAYVKSFSDEQLLQEFEKIRKTKSPEAPTPSMPEVPISPAVTSPPSSRTRRKSLGQKYVHKPKSTLPTFDLDATAQMFLKVVVDEDSGDEDSVDEVWSVVVGWELLSTPLGDINALYRIDGSTKHFATLRQILHMVDRQDLMKLYGLVEERVFVSGTKESWALLENLTLYDNESWNDPRDFAKSVKAISLPQDVPSTSDRHLIELENQVLRLMEAHLSLTQPTQVNKVTSSCEIYSGSHDTQYCMKNPKQAFVEYASLRVDEVGGLVSNFTASQDARLSKFKADFKQQREMTNKIDTMLMAITNRIAGALPSDTVKNLKLSASLVFSARSYPT
nr:hypothetical protein [Tanacetum cinerariifolium]